MINNASGFIIDIKKLNNIVTKHIVSLFDHSQIEKDIPWFKDKQPSTENLVVFIWNQINSHIPDGGKLFKVKLRETPTIYTEYYGPEEE